MKRLIQNAMFGGFALAALIGGCASNVASPPRVEDCAVVSISSPPKYVCGEKVYTAAQLAKIRTDEEKKYQSGK